MGFFSSIGNSFAELVHFDEASYRCEIARLSEGALRGQHRTLQRQRVGASTAIPATIAAAGPSGGLALLGTPVAIRRLELASRKITIVEARLRQRGWKGHDLTFRDVVVGAGPTAVTVLVAPGLDDVVDQGVHHLSDMAGHYHEPTWVGAPGDDETNGVVMETFHRKGQRAAEKVAGGGLHLATKGAVKEVAGAVIGGVDGLIGSSGLPETSARLRSRPTNAASGSARRAPTAQTPAAPPPTLAAQLATQLRRLSTFSVLSLLMFPAVVLLFGPVPFWLTLFLEMLLSLFARGTIAVIVPVLPAVAMQLSGEGMVWFACAGLAVVELGNRHGPGWAAILRRLGWLILYLLLGIVIFVVFALLLDFLFSTPTSNRPRNSLQE